MSNRYAIIKEHSFLGLNECSFHSTHSELTVAMQVLSSNCNRLSEDGLFGYSRRGFERIAMHVVEIEPDEIKKWQE